MSRSCGSYGLETMWLYLSEVGCATVGLILMSVFLLTLLHRVFFFFLPVGYIVIFDYLLFIVFWRKMSGINSMSG